MNPHGISTGCWDQRTLRELRNGALRLTEEKTYDRFGRLSKIKSGSSEVIYYYNSFNQFEKRLINNVPEYYYYTKYGQLRAKTLGAEEDKNPLTSLKYFYSRPGMIVAREVNGARQAIRKCADYTGSASNLFHDPFQGIVRTQTCPMLIREVHIRVCAQ